MKYFVNLNSKLIELKKFVSDAKWVLSIHKELVDLSQIVWKNWCGEKSFWLQRCIVHITPSSPRIWRRTTQANSILEIPAMAPFVKFCIQYILVAMGRFQVELVTINQKVRNWAHVKSSMIERGDPFVPSFHKTSDVLTFKIFLVCCSWIVYSWQWSAATDGVCEHHLTRPFFTVNYMHTHGSSLGPHSFHHIHASCALCERCVWLFSLFDDSTFLSPCPPSSLSSLCLSFCPSTSSRMWWTNSLCTSANKDLGTLAKYDPLTVSRTLLWWNLEKSYTRKFMCHLDHHQRFPSKKIGWKKWIQKSLEAAKTLDESNQKPNYPERRDP